MDESQYFDSNIENAVNLAINIKKGEKKDNISLITAVLPLIDPALSQKFTPVIKAININKILQNYISLSKQHERLKSSRRETIEALRGELDPHSQKILELFIKFNEIRDIMEVI